MMLGSGNRQVLSPFSRNMSRWEFKDFPTSKIELLKNNQLKIEHENIEIDSNIVSFGGAKSVQSRNYFSKRQLVLY